jgi:ribosomal protein L37AE/L43A
MSREAGWPIACEVVDLYQDDGRTGRDDWRTEIVATHPRLFQPGKGLAECREGWRHLINDACRKIDGALNWNAGDTICVSKIMERVGLLHIFWEGTLSATARVRVEAASEWAYMKSAHTCEFCGRHGQLYSCGGWMLTACKVHAKGQPASPKERVASIRIVRTTIAGQARILSWRQYDRERNGFFDVVPSSREAGNVHMRSRGSP